MRKTTKFLIWFGFVLWAGAGAMLMLETITPINEGLWILFLIPSAIVCSFGLLYELLATPGE